MKIIEQQKELHEIQGDQKENEEKIANLEEKLGDLQTEKEGEEHKLSSQVINLTEQLEKGQCYGKILRKKMFMIFNFSTK